MLGTGQSNQCAAARNTCPTYSILDKDMEAHGGASCERHGISAGRKMCERDLVIIHDRSVGADKGLVREGPLAMPCDAAEAGLRHRRDRAFLGQENVCGA